MIIKTDVVIIGCGVAALQAARILGQQLNVHIVTKSEISNSSSYHAQGGIAAVTDSTDRVELHIEDSLHAGVFHHHDDNVKTLVTVGSNAIHELISQGLPVDRTISGEISLGLEGAHSRSRIIHAGGDATGQALVEYLLQQLPSTVAIHPNEFAYELLINTDEECIGVKTLHGQTKKEYFATHTIIASGGAGALYSTTSNCPNSYGDGIALAFKAGAEIADMEFVQFHPSLLFINDEAHGLISEAVRGEGGRFINEDGNFIMDGVHPLGDLAPRHITAHEIYKTRTQGKNAYLDISTIKNFQQKFPTITQLCKENDIDLTEGRIPIAPGSHFLMGGIVADANGHTTIANLYAIGEVACTGVHGANRLASNSLLEGIAFGKNMANAILSSAPKKLNQQIKNTKYLPRVFPLFTKQQLQQEMMAGAGIVRSYEGLMHLQKQLPSLHQCSNINLKEHTRDEIELYFMHIVASIITNAALLRIETRGSHIRTDFPEKNPLWQKQWIITQFESTKVRSKLYEHHQARGYVEAIFY